jgi:hypothetical protein
MSHRLPAVSMLLLILIACRMESPSDSKLSKPVVSYFELSYSNGWDERCSITVDSNHIFHAPGVFDTIYYGRLPDSLIRAIDTTLSAMLHHKSPRIEKASCIDCPVFAIKAVVGADTALFFQQGSITDTVYRLISQIQQLAEMKHQYFNGYLPLETRNMIIASPQPVSR